MQARQTLTSKIRNTVATQKTGKFHIVGSTLLALSGWLVEKDAEIAASFSNAKQRQDETTI